jgi:hypothetical protein
LIRFTDALTPPTSPAALAHQNPAPHLCIALPFEILKRTRLSTQITHTHSRNESSPSSPDAFLFTSSFLSPENFLSPEDFLSQGNFPSPQDFLSEGGLLLP